MYGLPKDKDLAFLLGAELEQICVSRTTTILNFHPNVRVTILGDFGVRFDGSSLVPYSETTTGAVPLFALLHDTIQDARATESGGLGLMFKSGNYLEVFDDSDRYESLLDF